MKRKEGFTLIELLAVIVILAVIALIATPLIMGTIRKAKMNSLKDSAYGILKAGENYQAERLMNQEGTTTPLIIYHLESDTNLLYKGQKPKCGYLFIDSETEMIAVSDGQFIARKGENDKVATVRKGTCSEIKEEIALISKPVQDGLKVYLDGTLSPVLENSKMIWKDQSGNHYDGVLQNFESIESAWTGNSIAFQNNARNIMLSSALDTFPTKSFTIESFVKMNKIPEHDYDYVKFIVKRKGSRENDFIFIGATQQKWYGAVANTQYETLLAPGKIDAQKKHLLTETYDWDKKLLIIYLDGEELIRKTYESYAFTEHWTIGGSQNFEHVLDGEIYSARMYEKVLTKEEVKRNYQVDYIKYGK